MKLCEAELILMHGKLRPRFSMLFFVELFALLNPNYKRGRNFSQRSTENCKSRFKGYYLGLFYLYFSVFNYVN
jgi:hypothetical protein